MFAPPGGIKAGTRSGTYVENHIVTCILRSGPFQLGKDQEITINSGLWGKVFLLKRLITESWRKEPGTGLHRPLLLGRPLTTEDLDSTSQTAYLSSDC